MSKYKNGTYEVAFESVMNGDLYVVDRIVEFVSKEKNKENSEFWENGEFKLITKDFKNEILKIKLFADEIILRNRDIDVFNIHNNKEELEVRDEYLTFIGVTVLTLKELPGLTTKETINKINILENIFIMHNKKINKNKLNDRDYKDMMSFGEFILRLIRN